MSALTFHPVTPAAIAHIATHLRPTDRAELAITSPGQTLLEILHESVSCSRWSILACVDGVPAIVYGVAPSSDPFVGQAWMLATEDVRKVRREFIERCRGELHLMEQKYVVLTNLVHRENTLSIRWLEWLGFTVDRERPVGPAAALFVFWKGAARRCVDL